MALRRKYWIQFLKTIAGFLRELSFYRAIPASCE